MDINLHFDAIFELNAGDDRGDHFRAPGLVEDRNPGRTKRLFIKPAVNRDDPGPTSSEPSPFSSPIAQPLFLSYGVS